MERTGTVPDTEYTFKSGCTAFDMLSKCCQAYEPVCSSTQTHRGRQGKQCYSCLTDEETQAQTLRGGKHSGPRPAQSCACLQNSPAVPKPKRTRHVQLPVRLYWEDSTPGCGPGLGVGWEDTERCPSCENFRSWQDGWRHRLGVLRSEVAGVALGVESQKLEKVPISALPSSFGDLKPSVIHPPGGNQ